MTSIFEANGKQTACTIIEAGPCVVTQVKTVDSDGYDALQIAYGEAKAKNTPKAQIHHFNAANTTPKSVVKELRNCSITKQLGESITCEIFAEGEKVSVIGTTKGKGFQGVVKRHGFAGVGGRTHGQHNRGRHPGSSGACSTPSRVFKGSRRGGQTGNDRVTVRNLEILKVVPEKNLIVVSGALPGHNGAYVIIQK